MPIIAAVLTSQGLACDYCTDSVAMRANPVTDGMFVLGDPVSPGFRSIQDRGRCLSIQLVLDDGTVAVGDCLSVLRAGAWGRDAPFDPDEWEAVVAGQIASELVGVEITTFRDLARLVDVWVDGEPHLHPAVAYGLSQALLHATSLVRRLTMAEVVADEYGMPRPESPVPIFGGCDSRYPINVDRLIIGRADTLPHGGFSSVSMIGEQGEKLIEFVTWMRGRIEEYAAADYRPIVHLDVYGTIGRICDGDLDRMETYIRQLARAAAPLRLRLEDPINGTDAESSRAAMRDLVAMIDERGVPAEVVADEYCNTREDVALWARERAAHLIHVKTPDLGSLANTAQAVIACQEAGVGVYLGGTMNDTEVSARACLHVAIAFHADCVLARPGQLPDVSLALTRNEMNRTLTLIGSR